MVSYAHTHTHIHTHTQSDMLCPVNMFIYNDGHNSCSNTPVMLRTKMLSKQSDRNLQLAYNIYSMRTHISSPWKQGRNDKNEPMNTELKVPDNTKVKH